MRSALLVGVLVAASAPVASAGTFLGLAIGPSPAPDSSVDGVESSGRTGRVLGGYRLGQFSVEASATAMQLTWPRQNTFDWSYKQLTLAGKYSYPLGSGFEAFGKLGLTHGWLTDTERDWDDNGWTAGAGFEYALKLPFASGSVFVDYEYSKVSFDKTDTFDLTTRQWMLGATIGL